MARNVPGRRVAGAGVLVGASGLCVTEVGIDFFDDIDMVESVLSRVEFLREFFPKKLRECILLCCEKRFVEDIVAGWHGVSYRKGMIGCWYREIGTRGRRDQVLRFRMWLGLYLLRSNVAVGV